MASRKKKQAGIVRCFEVSDPTLHPKGHTIYKITQRVIKIDRPEDDIQEVLVWRRYNDFKKLYNAMSKLHQALHRQDEFPPFVEGKVFGRFDHEVISRRMLCGQDLLNFIGQRNYLVASRAFQQFFEGGEMRKFEGPPVLIPPIRDSKPIDDFDEEDFPGEDRPRPDGEDSGPDGTCGGGQSDSNGLGSENSGLTKVPSYNQLLGGVWRYRQIAEEISLGGDDDDEQTDVTDDSALSTPLPDGELSFFDPLMPQATDETDSKPETECSNEWLLSQVTGDDVANSDRGNEETTLKQLEEEFAAYDIGGSNCTSGTSSPLAGSVDFTNQDECDGTPSTQDPEHPPMSLLGPGTNNKPRSGSVVESGKGDLIWSPVHKQKPAYNRPLHSLTSTPSVSPLHSASSSIKGSPSRSPLHQTLVNIDVKDKADYIFLAANQISLAQQCEANNNYHMAFSYYKSAVGIMLTGVQLDDNKTRREVVRKKTAKYLLKAEELYHLYLDSCEQNQHGERWDTGKPSPAKELDPNVAFMQGSISELKSFKVLGVIDKVLLVIDTLSDHTFVFKVLHKSCSGMSQRRNIIPVHLPYMAQLHKFYETESAIYLLLQHASGGRLWIYVSGYMQQQHNDADLENILNDPHEKRLRNHAGTADSDLTLKGSDGPRDKFQPSQHGQAVARVTNDLPTVGTEKQDDELVTIGQNGVHFSNMENQETESDLKAHAEPVICDPPRYIPDLAVLTPARQKEDDGFSVDESQNIPACQKSKTPRKSTMRSVSTEVREGTECANASLDSSTHFEDILKGTIVKPSLEQFSINSFDSDSAPGSRYESVTSDFIESIPEVNESSPHDSPQTTQKSPVEVFADSENSRATSTEKTQISSPRVITSAMNVIRKASEELDDDILSRSNCTKDRSAAHDFDDLDLATPVAVVMPGGSKASPEEECSIYDVYKPKDGESDASSEAAAPLSKKNQESDSSSKNIVIDIRVSPTKSDINIHSPVMSPSKSLDSHSQLGVFRLPSQERSADTDSKPKKRHMSGLFGSFNVDEDDLISGVRLPEGCVKQWAAEILIAIASLHSMGVICRDLQPKNVLLGDRGHILLTYFSQWNCVDEEPVLESHELMYSAPEMGGVMKVSSACDWWSFGAILYELLTGKTLGSSHPSGITAHTQITVPGTLSTEAQALLKDLLKFHPEERLGTGSGGVEDIKMHPFFQGIDWNTLQAGPT